MRILTVRQPWAWAIIHGGKDLENRVRNIAGAYRGPVAIHAGAAWDWDVQLGVIETPHPTSVALVRGAIIGVVDLTDVHHAAECVYVGSVIEDFDGNFVSQEISHCSPWAEDANVYHLEIANPRPLAQPIPYRGALGLRTLDDATTARILEAIV